MPSIPKFDDPQEAIAWIRRLRISAAAKRELEKMILEASTPDRHNPNRLEPSHAENISTSIGRYTARTMNVISRGKATLMSLPDEQWNALVDEANAEHGDTTK